MGELQQPEILGAQAEPCFVAKRWRCVTLTDSLRTKAWVWEHFQAGVRAVRKNPPGPSDRPVLCPPPAPSKHPPRTQWSSHGCQERSYRASSLPQCRAMDVRMCFTHRGPALSRTGFRTSTATGAAAARACPGLRSHDVDAGRSIPELHGGVESLRRAVRRDGACHMNASLFFCLP